MSGAIFGLLPTLISYLGHANIVKYDKRPFASVREHDDTIINNWNSVVKPGDSVYHLGDVCFGCSKKWAQDLIWRLKGQIYLIRGNHDKYVDKPGIRERFVWVKDLHVMRLKEDRKVYQHITLCHYAMRRWYKAHYGTWHLYGHSHGSLDEGGYLAFDVGVNSHNYFPISLEYVKERLEAKTNAMGKKALKHHGIIFGADRKQEEEKTYGR